jgi:hypothetical protein
MLDDAGQGGERRSPRDAALAFYEVALRMRATKLRTRRMGASRSVSTSEFLCETGKRLLPMGRYRREI